MFAVIRKACLMEDEGRDEYIGSRTTLENAEKLRDEYVTRSKGYFSKSDIVITGGSFGSIRIEQEGSQTSSDTGV